MNRSVGQHHAGDVGGVLQGPAEGDRPTPVVRQRHHRSADVERAGEAAQVIDSLSQGARLCQTIGVAHAEVIHRDDAPARSGLSQHPAPEIGPRRVAVDTQHRADHGLTTSGHLWAVVQDVPAAWDACCIMGVDLSRPLRIKAGQVAGDHQASSRQVMFRPDPMPIISTRSPGSRFSTSLASVIATAAGPTLPSVGKVNGMRSVGKSRA